MNVRKAENHELKTILSLSPQAIFDGTLGEVMPSIPKVESLVIPLLEKGSFYLLAAEEAEIFGWVLLGTAKDPFTDQRSGFIFELYIRKEYRGKGISKELMNAAIEHFEEEGYEEVRLSAKAENSAVGLYEKIGFQTRSVSMSLKLK